LFIVFEVPAVPPAPEVMPAAPVPPFAVMLLKDDGPPFTAEVELFAAPPIPTVTA
jgi:hypothetical protein